jgi:predicted heme/steroid binding protein
LSDHDLFDDYEPAPPPTLEEERPARRRRTQQGGGDLFYNTAALFFVAASIAVVLVAALLVRNPTLPINPLPPATIPPTPTLLLLDGGAGGGDIDAQSEPTEAAVIQTPIPIMTSTPVPSPTTPPSATPRPAVTPAGTVTPGTPGAEGTTPEGEATNTPSPFAFTLQDEELTYSAYEGEEGCDYLAIAGEVFDVDGGPLPGVPVVVEGDEFFSALDFSGNAPEYGPSGYEIFVNDQPYEAEFTVRLVSETGMPLSEDVIVRTHDSCEENVVLVNFVANQPLD